MPWQLLMYNDTNFDGDQYVQRGVNVSPSHLVQAGITLYPLSLIFAATRRVPCDMHGAVSQLPNIRIMCGRVEVSTMLSFAWIDCMLQVRG